MASELIKPILKGDVHAVATLMSLIEDRQPMARGVLKNIYPYTGRALVVGVTGAAGTGKSSLISRMTTAYRRGKKSVGILAVDPSSLFSTGALLGDRIRMRDHFLDDGVFIRSFATRGTGGGLSAAVRSAIHVLDAMGKDIIIVETIGVGQDELEVAALAHMVVVVLAPEMGDEVQGMKAGLAEIADILAVNKADLSGAEQTVQQLKALFEHSPITVVATSALNNEGVHSLVNTIQERWRASVSNGDYQKKRFNLCRQELLSLLGERMIAKLAQKLGNDSLDKQVERIVNRKSDPYSVVDEIAKRLGL